MFNGEYQHNMDLKGRVTIPSKFRDDLGEKFHVCKGYDSCLVIYSSAEWEKFVEKLINKPSVVAKQAKRYFLASAVDVEPDKQGRILIPQHLREFAGIEKELVIIGVGDTAEIWNVDAWRAFNDNITIEEIERMMMGEMDKQ